MPFSDLKMYFVSLDDESILKALKPFTMLLNGCFILDSANSNDSVIRDSILYVLKVQPEGVSRADLSEKLSANTDVVKLVLDRKSWIFSVF